MHTPARVRTNADVPFLAAFERDLTHREGNAGFELGLQQDRLVPAHLEPGVDDVRVLVAARG